MTPRTHRRSNISACSAAPAAPCARVPYYSNPNVYAYDDWFRTGVTDYADNARLINDYAPYIAQYRPGLGRIFYDGFDDYSP
jgi:hypothetical protein